MATRNSRNGAWRMSVGTRYSSWGRMVGARYSRFEHPNVWFKAEGAGCGAYEQRAEEGEEQAGLGLCGAGPLGSPCERSPGPGCKSARVPCTGVCSCGDGGLMRCEAAMWARGDAGAVLSVLLPKPWAHGPRGRAHDHDHEPCACACSCAYSWARCPCSSSPAMAQLTLSSHRPGDPEQPPRQPSGVP